MNHRSGQKPFWRGKIPLALRRRASGLALLGRGWRDRLVFLLLLITVLTGPNGLLTTLPVLAATGSPFGKSGPPNRANPGQEATSKLHLPRAGTSDPNWRAHPPVSLGHAVPPPMQPGTLRLHAGTATQFVGSDGRLEVDVPVSAVTSSDETQAGGTLTLQINQIAPASGSSAGGSGLISFGTYLLQLVDVHGKRVPHGLWAPVTLTYHYDVAESALNLTHAFVVVNGPLPKSVKLAPAAVANTPDLGTRLTQNVTLDATQRTLTVTPLVGNPSSSISWNTNSPVASFGKPDIFNADLSAGSLSASYPIDVPAGPGGFTPPISLAYSSAGVSENHGVQSAAGWVGEGWTLAPGSISWAEHNTAAGCGSCSANWANSWQFSDPFGTSAELIPPTITTSISLDDTGQSRSSPVAWQTVPDAHIRVISYTGPNSVWAAPANPPCFRVFLQNGVMEEFGCTSDSLQYYYGLSGNNKGYAYVSSWLLDMVVDSAGNQIHYTYQADSELDSVGGHDIRDVVLSTIEWDSPTCQNTQTRCTGSTWAPLVHVSFSAAHNPLRLTALLPGVCNTGTNLRCDEPQDLSGSSGLAAPQVESTFVLNDIQVQVNTSGTWNTLKDYQLSYEQGGPGTITDPQTSKQESTAGTLDLTQISVVGDDGTTLEPARSFGYTSQTEHYEDDAYSAPAGNCGPSWNSGCLMWSQSYAGNSRYLAWVTNGMGLYQTLSWAEARNNTHGVNGGGSNTANPLYCDGKEGQGYPCSQADDQNWSHIVLTQEQEQVVRVSQNGQGGQQTNTTVTSQTAYTYLLTYPLSAQACSDCVAGMYWGNQNDADYLDYYNGKFQGFSQTTLSNPDGSMTVHKYYATLGWGIYDAPNTAPNNLTCYSSNPCHADPWWNPGNALHGHEYETDQYDTNGTTLLHKTTTQYSVQCPPSGVGGSGSTSYGNFDGNLVSELDHYNPAASCDIQTSQVDDYTLDGSNASGVPHQTTTYQYDPQGYGRVTQQTVTTNDGGATGSPTTLVTTTSYIWNDSVTSSSTSAGGTYLINFPAFTDTEDTSGNRYSCAYTSYDQKSYATGQQSTLTAGKVTATTRYTNCGTKANNFTDASGPLTTGATYDGFGNPQTTTDADGHTGCTPTGGSGSYTTCINYDTVFHTLPLSSANALNQSTSTGYTQGAAGGFGLWPTSTSDLNTQTTTSTYDGLGRMTSQTLPGETSGLTTMTWTYTTWCAQGGAQSPCVEIDQTQRLNSSTTVTTRAFYDGFGRLIELRSPGPNGQDVVRYRYYDVSGRVWFESIQYLVTAYTGAPGAAAYSIPDSQQAGTTTTYDGLGRVLTTKDALSNQTTTGYSVVCGTISGDSACYEQVLVTDPLSHQHGTLSDALGREMYDQRYTGNSAPYHVYATTRYTYDYNKNLTKILEPDNVTTITFQFDMAGRQTGLVDPDRGTESYGYDPNGNRTQSIDARGSSGTAYAGYDGLNRVLWRSTNSQGTNPYVTYTYDSTANGNIGKGRMTGETFVGGPNNSLSGSYSYVYDVRGQQISKTLVVGTTSYPFQMTYDDAGNILTQTYPTGEVVTNAYTGGWFSGLSQQQNSVNTTLMSNVSYTGAGGAGHMITGATLGGGTYQYTATYDLLQRQTELKDTRVSDNAVLFDEQRHFDAAGNITSVSTTLPQGTDVQQFCYDEQNRLTWAGSVGTPPCTGTAITPGTLTSAQYTQSFTYDVLGRLTNGPLGAYTYGSSAHLHAVTAIGSTFSASYDTAGNEICRSPSSTSACGGTPTGAALGYDAEGRLSHWQNTPTSPTTTDDSLYDGEGMRVEQQVTQGSSTTTTVYVGGFEEVSTTGSTTTTTYYYAGAMRIALAVNGVFSYLAANGLGSTSVALTTSGSAQASALYYPYGGGRYTNGTMPGSYSFTGQQVDSTTGLDYFAARYYDPFAGQFVSPDTVLPGKGFDPWGLSRYAYVEGNPAGRTDPTGHWGTSCRVDCNESDPATLGCDYCQQINTTFHDDRTRRALIALLFSPFGTEVVEFLLKFAAYLAHLYQKASPRTGQQGAFKADDLFTYDTSIGLSAGSNDGETITLNPNADLAVQGGVIAHEAMEVYFQQADGVNPSSFQMDYIADYMKGQVQTDIATAGGGANPADGMPDAFGENYLQWRQDKYGGKTYEPGFFGWGGPGDSDNPGGPKSDNNFLGNPMGLSLSMLRWESSNPTGSGLYGH